MQWIKIYKGKFHKKHSCQKFDNRTVRGHGLFITRTNDSFGRFRANIYETSMSLVKFNIFFVIMINIMRKMNILFHLVLTVQNMWYIRRGAETHWHQELVTFCLKFLKKNFVSFCIDNVWISKEILAKRKNVNAFVSI